MLRLTLFIKLNFEDSVTQLKKKQKIQAKLIVYLYISLSYIKFMVREKKPHWMCCTLLGWYSDSQYVFDAVHTCVTRIKSVPGYASSTNLLSIFLSRVLIMTYIKQNEVILPSQISQKNDYN